ncbi:Lrp/AsnC family transcriptional regulator [Brevundimonas diminuta]|uniref:Lrp/AsnC family transcriptional regulator n=1 Tax=Brevundimonas diminuta TaxID=293 RepID=UPI0037CAF797
MSEELTTIDLKILEQLQQDATLSTTELAERVGLSQSPCWRRLQRLKEEGYIQSQVAVLDRRKFGESQFIFATLRMNALTDDQRLEFTRKIAAIPEIMECHSIFGERDILLKVIARSLDWYQRFIFNVILKLPGVVDVQSIVALSEFKHTSAIPVRGDRAL